MPHHLYHYVRAKDDEYGKAGTPYYVGISSGRVNKRRFDKHREGIPVPDEASGCNVVVAYYETVELLLAAEKLEVERWGRIGIDSGGVLMNRSMGGQFKLDSDWTRKLKLQEGQWKRRYSRMVRKAAELGITLPPCMKRVPDHRRRQLHGPANKGKPKQIGCNAFVLWNVLSAQDRHDPLYLAAVRRLYRLRGAGHSLRHWLRPGQAIQCLDDCWTPAQCCKFLVDTADVAHPKRDTTDSRYRQLALS